MQYYRIYNGHHPREQGNGHQTHPNYDKHVEAIERGRKYLAEARSGKSNIG